MELLKKLTEFDAPSSREKDLCEFIAGKSKDMGYDVAFDGLGSVIAHKKGNGKKLMFAAHVDEIGIIVNYINGFIRFGAVGGLQVKEMMKRRVKFNNGTVGVIACDGNVDKPEIGKMYIDLGVKSKADAEKLVSVGDTAAFTGEFAISGDTVISKALDDRAGCYILLKAMESVKSSANDLYFVFSTQEEVGLRGGKTSAFSVMPDIGIAVDVTGTGDTPDAPKMDVRMGEGCAIKVMDRSVMCNPEVVEALRELAEKNEIPYTNEILTYGGTDAGAIALTGAGVKAGGISIPVRYIHSPSEMASVSDIKACVDLLIKACEYTW